MRRPLVAVFDEHPLVGTSPMERMLERFGWQSNAMPPYVQWCIEPNFKFQDVEHIVASMGFEVIPEKRVDRYPTQALINAETGRRQHPTWFLQWGWAIKPHKQILLELGDARFFTSLNFIKEMPGKNGTPWHLDHVELFLNRSARPVTLSCGIKGQTDMVRDLLIGTAEAIAHLNNDRWEDAESSFHGTMDNIMRTLEGNPRVSDTPANAGAVMRKRHG